MFLLSEFAAIVFADGLGDVDASLVVGRNAVELGDAVRSGVVGGEGLGSVSVVHDEEFAEIASAPVDVFAGIEAVLDSEFGGSGGHKLHESLGTLGRDGARVAAALATDDAGDEVGIDAVSVGGVGDVLFNRLHRRGDGLRRRGRWREIRFEGNDVGGGYVDEILLVGVGVETSGGAENLAAFMTDGESVAQGGEVRREGGGRQERKNGG